MVERLCTKMNAYVKISVFLGVSPTGEDRGHGMQVATTSHSSSLECASHWSDLFGAQGPRWGRGTGNLRRGEISEPTTFFFPGGEVRVRENHSFSFFWGGNFRNPCTAFLSDLSLSGKLRLRLNISAEPYQDGWRQCVSSSEWTNK